MCFLIESLYFAIMRSQGQKSALQTIAIASQVSGDKAVIVGLKYRGFLDSRLRGNDRFLLIIILL
jgi:hypothetical protein